MWNGRSLLRVDHGHLANCDRESVVKKYGVGEGINYTIGLPYPTRTKRQDELLAMGFVGVFLIGSHAKVGSS